MLGPLFGILPWWLRALAVAAASWCVMAALAYAVHRLDASRQQIGYDRAQAEYNQAALVAEELARETEHKLQADVARVEKKHEQTKQQADMAAVAAAAELDGLRGDLAARDSTTAASASPACRADAARAASVERELLGQCAAALTNLAKEADRLEGRLTGLQDYVRAVVPAAGAP